MWFPWREVCRASAPARMSALPSPIRYLGGREVAKRKAAKKAAKKPVRKAAKKVAKKKPAKKAKRKVVRRKKAARK